MKTLKILFSSLIFMFFNIGLVFSDITASAPTNLISSIATATSFTSLEQISPEAASEIQNTTSSIVDSEALQAEVQESAEAFGEMISQATAGVVEDKNEKFAVLGGNENEYDDKRDLEPTLGTIIYDTGMVSLDREGGHYDTDNKDKNGNSKEIFAGTQKARVIVYVDFNRKVLFGSVESQIKLTSGKEMNNLYNGSSTTISKDTLPVDKELVHTVSSTTGLTLDPDGDLGVNGDGEPFPYIKNEGVFLNSLLKENGDMQEYDPGFFNEDDRQDMVKSVSHGANGDNNVLVQARFKTASELTPGTTVVSFEAHNGAACATNPCSGQEKNDFANNIERYSKTVSTTATKFTGDLPQ